MVLDCFLQNKMLKFHHLTGSATAMVRPVALVVLVLCLLPALLLAQSDTATISGLITDSKDAVLVGAQVSAFNVESGTKSTALTNRNGVYVLRGLRPGQYRLVVDNEEFSEQYHVQVLCRSSDVPDNLSADVSLCLFRVIQEALHNVVKHSHATKVDVDLQGTPTFLRLSISDDGVGFAPNAANARPGLGLTSMRERLHLIGGKFAILSKPGSGTRVEATVPMASVPMTKTEPATRLVATAIGSF